jgi:mRNA-degrading endonuclease YafQ of YafQ-DinJ toxin-antitoxin module
MLEIGYSTSFLRALKKLIKNNPDIEEIFWGRVDIFFENPFDKKLKTHKLTGNLKDLWSFSVDYYIRVVFYFESKEKVTFIDIGNHSEVY